MLQNCTPAHSAINTFIFLKELRKKIIFCWKQFTGSGKAINLEKPLIKKNTQTFPKMRDDSMEVQLTIIPSPQCLVGMFPYIRATSRKSGQYIKLESNKARYARPLF